jgi:hypothetical protein
MAFVVVYDARGRLRDAPAAFVQGIPPAPAHEVHVPVFDREPNTSVDYQVELAVSICPCRRIQSVP